MSSSTILVVYQNEMYLRRVRDALSPAGYEVRTADSAAAAVAEVQRSCPRVVVVCPCVGAEARREITWSIQQLHPNLPVLHLDANHVDDISKWPIQ
jgi:DNA-binding NtrC family response regulator